MSKIETISDFMREILEVYERSHINDKTVPFMDDIKKIYDRARGQKQ